MVRVFETADSARARTRALCDDWRVANETVGAVARDVQGALDPLGRYLAASERCDIDELMATLAPDVELVSPISGHLVFSGHDDIRTLLAAVYQTTKELRWHERVGDGEVRVVTGQARVARVTLSDAMLFELDSSGQIKRITPHLRPWLALSLFALALGARMVAHPGIILRALLAGRRAAARS
jgi:hypothetical protein